jgi:hypothetical protein
MVDMNGKTAEPTPRIRNKKKKILKKTLRKPTNGTHGTNGRNCVGKEQRNTEQADDMQNEQHSEQCFNHCQTRNCSNSSDYEE